MRATNTKKQEDIHERIYRFVLRGINDYKNFPKISLILFL